MKLKVSSLLHLVKTTNNTFSNTKGRPALQKLFPKTGLCSFFLNPSASLELLENQIAVLTSRGSQQCSNGDREEVRRYLHTHRQTDRHTHTYKFPGH
jgi:hypothetical protein